MNDWKTKASALERGARSGPGRHAEFHHRLAVFEMRDEPRREFVGVHRRRIGKLAALAESHEMIAKATSLPALSSPPLKKWKPGRAVEIVLHVVLAGPQQASPARRPVS